MYIVISINFTSFNLKQLTSTSQIRAATLPSKSLYYNTSTKYKQQT